MLAAHHYLGGGGLLVAGLVSSGLGLGLMYITVQGGIGCLWLGEW